MRHFRGGQSLRPINRIKHVVDSAATLTAAGHLAITLVNATDTPLLADTDGVETGSKVNGIYLRAEVASNQVTEAGAIPNVYMFVWKNPGGNLTRPNANAVGSNDNKKFVIHQEMTMIENQVSGNARTIFNGVIVIPKGMRRFGPNDLLQVVFLSPALDTSICIQCHYKEFR